MANKQEGRNDTESGYSPELTGGHSVRRQRQLGERHLRLFVESVKDYAFFTLDLGGRIETWNEGARRINGYPEEEIVGKHFAVLYAPEDVESNKPKRELEIAGKEGLFKEEGWRIRRDGTRFWADVVTTALRDPDGTLTGFGLIIRDLTERKVTDEVMRESDEHFRLMIESIKDYAIFMLDSDGRIVSWNEGARRLKGYEAKEVLGKNFTIFYEIEEVNAGKCEYELKEAATVGRFEDEGWRLRKDGTKFWANVVITALRDSGGGLRGFAKVTRDMTERKRAEDKIKMAQESLERRVDARTKDLKRAIEARDEFLSIASHELRTPLTALKLQQQVLERQIAKTAGAALSIRTAKLVADMTGRQVSQLSRLVGDMLDVSRISAGRLRIETKECNLSELTAKIFESFSLQLQSSGTRVNLDLGAEVVTAFCDAQRIEQVISNLLSNAVKYGNNSPINLTLRRAGLNVEIIVEDSGPGIDPKDQRRIFERYERAISASEVSGMGLGLFISKQIVEAHGGTIRVESEIKRGAKFVVSLPVRAKA